MLGKVLGNTENLVLRKVLGKTRDLMWGKLSPNQEGLYKVTSISGNEAYRFEDLDESLQLGHGMYVIPKGTIFNKNVHYKLLTLCVYYVC